MLIQVTTLHRVFAELAIYWFSRASSLVSWHLLFWEVPFAVLAGLTEVHLLDVLFLFIDVDELAALFAFANVASAIGIMAVDFG